MVNVTDVTTLRSLPGDWIDRRGLPQPRLPVRRILVVKPDHIGDLLVVDTAFAQLRQFFPDARLELICGTWNVALAQRLGRFDAVHGVNLFHEVSGQQRDIEIAEQVRRRGAETLRELNLGPFDLVIDLRYDVDSRPLLKNVDARVYAGFGTASQFPFLDIVLPMHHPGAAQGPNRVVLVGRDMFIRQMGPGSRDTGTGAGGELSSRRTEIMLEFDIDGAASPRQIGTSQDDRLLGIGLERVAVIGLDEPDAEFDPDDMEDAGHRFEHGWSNPEPWGTWSTSAKSRISVPVGPDMIAGFVRIELRMRAHVNQGNRRVEASIGTGVEGEEALLTFQYPSSPRSVSLTIPTRLSTVSLVSPPFDLAPGRYRGFMRLYVANPVVSSTALDLVVRTGRGNAPLVERGFTLGRGDRGIVNVPFECVVDVAGEPLTVEISSNQAQLLDGARVEYVSFNQEEAFSTRIPVAHMGHWASLLVLRTAQVFSDEPPFRRSAAESKLFLCDQDQARKLPEPVQALRARIDAWQRGGHAVIGVAVGCNTVIRKWPFLHFVELSRHLMEEGPVKIVFIGGPADAEESRLGCRLLGLDADEHMACGISRIEDLGFVLEQLDLFVGSNTGTTHFAGKVGVRTIGVYAGTNHPREWGPIGENSSWVMRDEPCAPCHLTDIKDCRFWHSCMINLAPEDVLKIALPELRAVLSRRSRLRTPEPALA